MEVAFEAVECAANLEALALALVVLVAVLELVDLAALVKLVGLDGVLVESDLVEKLVGPDSVGPAEAAEPVADLDLELGFEAAGPVEVEVEVEVVEPDLEDVECCWWVVRVGGPEVTPDDVGVFVALAGE